MNEKRPGGELQGRPVQSPDGKWRNQFGEIIEPPKIQSRKEQDAEFARRFWKASTDKGEKFAASLHQTIKENILSAAAEGMIYIIVDKHSITEADKEKLSAYREIARSLGYEVGSFRFNEKAGNAAAPIKKLESPET